MRWVQALFVVEGFAGEDAVDLEEAASVGVAEGGFHVPEAEADGVHLFAYFGHEGLALVEGDEGHFELDGDGVGAGAGSDVYEGLGGGAEGEIKDCGSGGDDQEHEQKQGEEKLHSRAPFWLF